MRVLRMILAVVASTLVIFGAQSALVASADPPGMTHDGTERAVN
jgi:hypothetical protein